MSEECSETNNASTCGAIIQHTNICTALCIVVSIYIQQINFSDMHSS